MIAALLCGGRTVDLLEPRAADVDFAEVALALARITRGNGTAAISTALHTLIAHEAAVEELKPFVLLRRCHEAWLGHVAAPTREALVELGGYALGTAMVALVRRHDRAIHDAAGLPLPTFAQRVGLEIVEAMAIATEHRDFGLPVLPTPPGRAEACPVAALSPQLARAAASPTEQAAMLLHLFRHHLPALQRAHAPEVLHA